SSDNVTAKVTILEKPEEYIPLYSVEQPVLHKATHAVLDHVRSQVISMVQLSTSEFIDPKAYKDVKKKFMDKAREIIDELLPESSENEKKILVGILIHEMIGLGDIEILLNDNYLEEIVVNNCEEPVWVYHKKFGWLKTNITYKSEEAIYNNMTAIGRKVGRQITNIHPLMDAHLSTGDRVNATLFPISTKGNTMTIRRFSRSPWTIINMIDPKVKTMSLEIAAILWLSIQYELNILVVGGTASGKTSLLNAILPFIPPNQRIISIEDTREIQLPKYLHWIPFSAREPNPEGQGGVSMLDLLTNSLRMRPDRIIVGEIRRSKEAEVMFEAIRTGHSAYATFHSDTAEQAYKRLTNPPISLPEPLISALHLILVQYRHRRKGIRRSLELAELIPLDDMSNKVNVIYKWNARNDEFEKVGRYIRVINEINLFTGMDETEIERNLKDKETILKWMLDNNIKDVNAVGKVFAEYYKDEKKITALAKSNGKPEEILDPELMKKIREQD
ncbi:MAG: type II/IV secretion system ATPase subunit, partial [Candidatus Aenigmarchaeota archaeon]|nr:type II/IV secretion system ATPase subunit [Candidatus Aenigmarchaeota archaeon]